VGIAVLIATATVVLLLRNDSRRLKAEFVRYDTNKSMVVIQLTTDWVYRYYAFFACSNFSQFDAGESGIVSADMPRKVELSLVDLPATIEHPRVIIYCFSRNPTRLSRFLDKFGIDIEHPDRKMETSMELPPFPMR